MNKPAATDPAVDVIIPLFNKGSYVAQAVRSALDQSLPPRTVCVADDASTDGGAQIVEAMAAADPRILLLRSSHGAPHGASSARNRAVAATTSEFVAFLDADDFWERGKLATQMPLFADPSIGTVHCAARVIDADGRLVEELYPQPLEPGASIFDEVRLGRYPVTGSASGVVTRRRLIEEAGPFAEDMAYGEDWEMWSRLAGLSGFAAIRDLLANIRALQTPSRAAPSETFVQWLAVFERWADDERFMQLAKGWARTVAVWRQLEMRQTPWKMLVGFPLDVARSRTTLGRAVYGSPAAYVATISLLLRQPTGAILHAVSRTKSPDGRV